MGDPMHIYPDPNGGANSNAYVPSNTGTATGAIVSGAVAVGAAAPAVGGAIITNLLAFIQAAPGAQQTVEQARFLGLHGLGPGHIAVILFFGSLSVLLQVINLVSGLRMKERLAGFSRKVCDVCEKAGLLKAP
jgi:hypothetical protein